MRLLWFFNLFKKKSKKKACSEDHARWLLSPSRLPTAFQTVTFAVTFSSGAGGALCDGLFAVAWWFHVQEPSSAVGGMPSPRVICTARFVGSGPSLFCQRLVRRRSSAAEPPSDVGPSQLLLGMSVWEFISLPRAPLARLVGPARPCPWGQAPHCWLWGPSKASAEE